MRFLNPRRSGSPSPSHPCATQWPACKADRGWQGELPGGLAVGPTWTTPQPDDGFSQQHPVQHPDAVSYLLGAGLPPAHRFTDFEPCIGQDSPEKQNQGAGVPWGLSRLGIWCRHGRGVGSIPGISYAAGAAKIILLMKEALWVSRSPPIRPSTYHLFTYLSPRKRRCVLRNWLSWFWRLGIICCLHGETQEGRRGDVIWSASGGVRPGGRMGGTPV